MRHLLIALLALVALPSLAVEKFGRSESVDTAENPATVWDGINLGGDDQYPDNVTTLPDWDDAAVTLYISSDTAGDTEPIRVQGLDADGNEQDVLVTLAGLTFTQVGAATNWRRVYRAFSVGTTDLVGDVYIHTDSADAAVADGIPDTPAADILAAIPAVNASNQTLMAFYTVPVDKQGLLKQWCWNVNRASTAAEKEANFELQTRETAGTGIASQVWRTQHTFGANNRGKGRDCHDFMDPSVLPPLTDVRVRASVLVNSTDVGATFHVELEDL